MKTAKPADAEAGPPDRNADKRSSILNAAAKIFLNGGYLGTSMDEIAAKAGVAKQTINSTCEADLRPYFIGHLGRDRCGVC